MAEQKTYECLKGVFAPMDNVTSHAYLPGDEITEEALGESKDEFIASGHIGKRGQYAKLVKAQQKADASGMNTTVIKAELAKQKVIAEQKDEEIAQLQQIINDKKGKA